MNHDDIDSPNGVLVLLDLRLTVVKLCSFNESMKYGWIYRDSPCPLAWIQTSQTQACHLLHTIIYKLSYFLHSLLSATKIEAI